MPLRRVLTGIGIQAAQLTNAYGPFSVWERRPPPMADENMIVEISCFEVWRRLSDYVDDVEPELKARLTLHFARCRDCKALLDGTRNVVALIGDEQAFDLPAGAS